MSAAARRVLAAPDKFKGTIAAAEVAAAIGRAAHRAGWVADELPIADGGEGTADALLAARGGRWVEADATDPLGRALRARFALLADGVAVVEVAAASGLTLLKPHELDALAASSRGTGELIVAATAAGAREIVVAAGGSATTDGGTGALEVLRGRSLPPLVVACDTRVPFERAARVYGPQKGADEGSVAVLERRLEAIARAAPRDPREIASSGAAGGLAGGLWAWLGARLEPGAAVVLDALGADARIAAADLVVTGEGRIDAQTATGKAVGELAGRCREAGVPCHAIVGRDGLAAGEREALGLATVREAGTPAAIERAVHELLRVG